MDLRTRRKETQAAIYIASLRNVVIPPDVYRILSVPSLAVDEPERGYIRCPEADEATLRLEAEAGRELMKELTWNS